jgi:hypothetical protein
MAGVIMIGNSSTPSTPSSTDTTAAKTGSAARSFNNKYLIAGALIAASLVGLLI